MRIAIAGASGNLGLFLSRFLSELPHELVLFTHRRKLPQDLVSKKNVIVRRIDLGDRAGLRGCCEGVDCAASMAGVLFQGAPENFLPITNTEYVANLALEAASAGVKKFLLLSFPHVEGETFPDTPAPGLLPAENPEAIHARTRLEGERRLIAVSQSSDMKYLILRAGVVYGKGVKLIESARRMMHWRCLAIWRKPTWIHLLHVRDLLEIIRLGIETPGMDGILNVADDHPLLLQDFLDTLAAQWGYRKPIRLPAPFFFAAAHGLDLFSRVSGRAIPLNPDILKMGMTSSVADVSRLKHELGYTLKYPTLNEGLPSCRFDR
ncbi:MAG TPA: NAD-dependent epimerase/dehydratase family protein [Acidobacteriota bacterium]|nr:NAD-dependent epimerase/dehydratase family protein [Acidobacteriota bacterium]